MDTNDQQDYVRALINAVERGTPLLLALGDEQSIQRPAPGHWSPREIMGHLIDSASNNHQRFVRAQFQDDLIFTGYEQEAWVTAQRYQETQWEELVGLWAGFNRHLARVMMAVPEAVRMRERWRHNLHEIAWQTVPPEQPATLDYFMRDYVCHLYHHLKQILGPAWDAPAPPHAL